jgi:integrase
MTKFELPFVDAQRGRDGAVKYWYFRRSGRRWRLPGTPLSVEFMEAYQRLVAETNSTTQAAYAQLPHYGPDSFGRLVNEYLASGVVRDLKASTKAEYTRVLGKLVERHGQKLVRDLKRPHVRKIRDAEAETPAKANTIVRILKLILNFAIEEEWIEVNPAAKVKLLKVGEWRAWSDEECAKFEARWAPGTMQRRAYALALYTGQRKGDLVLMSRAHRRAGTIRVVQGKTGAELWIPEHRELLAELSRGVSGHMSLLTTSQGKAFDAVYFGAWFADAIDAAELPDDCVLHGLRKTATRRLAEAGCTTEEIKSITGHASDPMVARYAKAANKQRLASAAIHKLENSK